MAHLRRHPCTWRLLAAVVAAELALTLGTRHVAG